MFKKFVSIILMIMLIVSLSNVNLIYTSAEGNTTLGYSKLGVNLEGLSDFSSGHMFVDAMKTSREWGSASTPWSKISTVDSSGWPTTDAGVIVFTDAVNYDISGTYNLSFEGTADVTSVACGFSVLNKQTSNGITTADIVVPVGQNQLMMAFTNTVNGVRNVKLIRPGYGANTTQTFTNQFLSALAPFSTIRFMDYLSTNTQNSLSVEPWRDLSYVLWANRRLPSDASQSSDLGKKIGGSWEYIIELANLTGKDIWINVPYNADNNYMTSLAQMLKNNLNTNVNIYVELSNEVWNWQFAQAGVNNDLAQTDPDAQGNYFLMYAKQVSIMSNTFKNVFGSSAMNNKVRVILGIQIGYGPCDYWPREMLNFINQKFGDPSQIIYSLAGAPYIAESKPEDSTSIQVVLNSFISSSDAGVADRSKIITLARDYNLVGGASCYEGGTHHQGQVETNLDIRKAANRDPAMKDIIVRDIQNNWIQIGGGVFMYFSLSGTYSKYGCWGLTENISNLSAPKYQGIVQISNATIQIPTFTPAPTITPTPAPINTPTMVPTPTPRTYFYSASINFEELSIGEQNPGIYTNSDGFKFTGFYSPNSSINPLVIHGISENYASNVLCPQNWQGRIEITRDDNSSFNLDHFDYVGDPYGTVIDATISGIKMDDSILSDSITSSTKAHSMKTLNWTGLKKVIIDYNGGVSNGFGGIDNLEMGYYSIVAPLGSPTPTPVPIGFEDLTLGDQASNSYTHSSGFKFDCFYSPNLHADSLIVRGTNEGYASKVLCPQNWQDRIEIIRENNGTFNLASFDYTGDPWGGIVDATVTGIRTDNSTITSDIYSNNKTHKTKILNWTNLKKVIIDFNGGETAAFCGLDNFALSS